MNGWYIGNATNPYRCHRIYIPKTRAKRIARTVEFLPHLYDMPATSSVDAPMEGARELTAALQNTQPSTTFAPIKDAQLSAMHQLIEIFSTNSTNAPTPSPTDASSPRVEAPPIQKNCATQTPFHISSCRTNDSLVPTQ